MPIVRLDMCGDSYTNEPAAQGKNAQRKRDLQKCDSIDGSFAGHSGFLTLCEQDSTQRPPQALSVAHAAAYIAPDSNCQ